MKIYKKKAVTMFVLTLLMASLAFVQVGVAQAGYAFIDPEVVETDTCQEFTVTVLVDVAIPIQWFEFWLYYDSAQMSYVNHSVIPPWIESYRYIAPGVVGLQGIVEPPPHPGSPGILPLADITFHCDAPGTSGIYFDEVIVMDYPAGDYYPLAYDYPAATVEQFDLYWKPPQIDYAPSGVPDFDQRQDEWVNPYPPVGSWSYCGPTAVANSLWWLDSQFEPNPVPPPEINDGFPLVESYNPGVWDDHDPQNVPPLIEHLAYLMNTNNLQGIPENEHCGTTPTEMQMGIDMYLEEKGLDWKFYEHTEKAPDFYWIEEQVEKCEDVILLLGFWQSADGVNWWRPGGHYVTVVGVDSIGMYLAVSDPFRDAAEFGGIIPGQVLPPGHGPGDHPISPPETLHNNATYVSHDIYQVGMSPSPGGPWGLVDYYAEEEGFIDNFDSCQNLPEEFMQFDGDYVYGLPVYTEIEYAIIVSCETGRVAAGSEDGMVYVHDFYGNLLWNWGTEAYCVSVAFDNDARYLAGGWRYSDYGELNFFDVNAVTGGGWNPPLWSKSLVISESYAMAWEWSRGNESMSVDVKYNFYNQSYVVAAAHDYGLNLYDEWGNLIWQYFDEYPETIVRISQDGNYIVCAGTLAQNWVGGGTLHYFSHLRDGVPGWGPGDGTPLWSVGGELERYGAHWTAISGIGDYVAVSGWEMVYGNETVVLLNRTGGEVWSYVGSNTDGGAVTKVDMPCHGRSVVAVTEDMYDWVGCDLLYFDDGGDGWDSGDDTPVWTYWPGKVDFFDDVESGTDGWTSDGLWHITSHRSFSPTHAWYYGQEGVWTFDTGVANRGNLTSPTIDLTSATMANMTFKYWYETEESGTTYDQRWVDISVDGGLFAPFVQLSGDPMGVWLNITIDLAGFVGHDIQIQFRFDTIDEEVNSYEGWYIDDVAINAEEGGEHDVYDDFYTVSISGNGDVISAGGDDGTSNLYVFGKDGTLLDKEWDGVTVQSVDQTFAGQYGVVGSCDSGYAMYDKSIGSWAWIDNAFGPIRSVAISKIYPCMFPFPNHDVAIIDVVTSKTGCLPMPTVGQNLTAQVNVTVENQGNFTETSIQVTVYANNTFVGTQTIPSLAPSQQIVLSFTWDTTGFPFGDYIINAIATIVQDEIDVSDNNFVNDVIKVVIPGDVNGDGKVNILDAIRLAGAFGARPGDSNWNPNADINGDGVVNILDAIKLAGNFGKLEP